jgi:hypothetical protein
MRRLLKYLLSFLAGIALLWLCFWWYAESRIEAGFLAWANRQAARGEPVSYDSIHRGTSPFTAGISISNFSILLPPIGGRQAILSLPTVGLSISPLNPLVFRIELPDKMTAMGANGLDLVFSIGGSRMSEDLDPDVLFKPHAYPFRASDLSLQNVDVLASGSLLILHFDNFSAHAELNLEARPGTTFSRDDIRFDGVAVSPILTRIASLPFGGKLAHLDISMTLLGPAPANLPSLLDQAPELAGNAQSSQQLISTLQEWAREGGSGTIGVTLALGPTTARATGSIAFDAAQQPNGTAALSADHLDAFSDAILASYPALQADIAATEARLSPYLGNSTQGGQTLALHLDYGKSGVFINGQKTADMPPLDWEKLQQ